MGETFLCILNQIEFQNNTINSLRKRVRSRSGPSVPRAERYLDYLLIHFSSVLRHQSVIIAVTMSIEFANHAALTVYIYHREFGGLQSSSKEEFSETF